MTQVSSDSRGLPGATARDDDNAAQQSRTQKLTKQKNNTQPSDKTTGNQSQCLTPISAGRWEDQRDRTIGTKPSYITKQLDKPRR